MTEQEFMSIVDDVIITLEEQCQLRFDSDLKESVFEILYNSYTGFINES